MGGIISTKDVWSGDEKAQAKAGDRWVLLATFLVPALVVVALLIVLVSFRGGIEAAVANLADLLPVGYAFAAGMVASANPCGVLMLPTYALQQLRAEGGPRSAGKRALRAVQVAAAVTSGFVVVFSLTGAAIAGGGQWLISVFPYAGLLIGVAMVALGAWLLATNKTLSLFGQTKVTAERAGGRGAGNAFLFGIAYALGSLSCTLPIFLVVVGTSLSGGGFGGAFGQFVGYALGMGSIIFAITIGAALFRRAMTRWLRAVTPYIHRMSSMFLVGAGLYLVYYWVFQAGLG